MSIFHRKTVSIFFLLLLTFFFCNVFIAQAGDDVDETVQLVAVSPNEDDFVFLETWKVIGAENSKPFPMFLMHYNRFGKITQFIEIPLSGGMGRSRIQSKEYQEAAVKEWERLIQSLRLAAYADNKVWVSLPIQGEQYASVILPNGNTVLEKGTVLPRKKNHMEEERIDLWEITKDGKTELRKKGMLQTVIRWHAFTRKLEKAYYLPKSQLLFMVYPPTSEYLSTRNEDIWVEQWK